MPKLLWMVFTMAMSYLAMALLKPKQAKNPLDDSKTEPSNRGTLLGVLLGHYRIGPVVGFVGNRYTVEEDIDAGGKGGGGLGKGGASMTAYHESGWHMLNMGTGSSIRRIYQSGKPLWQGNITPTSHPSGSTVDLGNEGRFSVYWGEANQPVCADLAVDTGISSRWPYTFYIYWHHKRLGPSPVWPSLEYEVTTDPIGTGKVSGDASFDFTEAGYSGFGFEVYYLVGSSIYGSFSIYYWDKVRIASETAMPDLVEGMDVNISYSGTVVWRAQATSISRYGGYTYIEFNTNLPKVVFNTEGWNSPPAGYTFGSDAFSDMGASPAVSIDHMLFMPRPFGAGMDRFAFDTSLQTFHDLMETEEMPCTTLLRSGRSWQDGVASIMQDMGALLVLNPVTGLYGIRAMRDGASVSNIAESYYDGDDIEETYAYSVLAADSRVFSYKDSARNFADSTLPATDDTQAKYGADPNVKSVPLETITSYKPASRVASRRDGELSVDGVVKLKVSYLIALEVGNAVQVDGFDRIYRVASIKSDPDDASREISLVEDSYITGADYSVVAPSGLNPGNRRTVMPDNLVVMVEANRFLYPDQHGVHILRIRYNQLSMSAFVYASSDDTSYELVGDQIACTGGLLTEALSTDTGGIVETGPEVELFGEDISKILDLTSLDADWRAGRQMCMIGSELFFISGVTITGSNPTTFTLDNMIRARLGTNKEAHSVDDAVFIFQPSQLKRFTTAWLLAGQDTYAKTQPYNHTSVVDIADVDGVSLTPYQGGGYRPLPCLNLNTDDDTSAWLSGGDASLRWDYRNGASGSGAGMFLSDEPYEQVDVEGYFKLEILSTGDSLKRTEILSTAAYNYTNADMVTDFGAAPSQFKARVYNVLNGLTSDYVETTFTKL